MVASIITRVNSKLLISHLMFGHKQTQSCLFVFINQKDPVSRLIMVF